MRCPKCGAIMDKQNDDRDFDWEKYFEECSL